MPAYRGKGVFRGEITQIRVNQIHYYSRQWGVESRNRIYIISETIDNFRKHDWLCSCPDWINHRQKYPPPHDRCKHIDAVVNEFGTVQVISPSRVQFTAGLLSRVENIQFLSPAHFLQSSPLITIQCNWSGRDLFYNHIISIPPRAIPITVVSGYLSFPVGYIEGNTAHIALNSHSRGEFNETQFLTTYEQRHFSPEQSERLLRMEAQRDRLEKNFDAQVETEFEIFDGKFTDADRAELDALLQSTTIDGYEIIDTSIVLHFNDRKIKQNGRTAWEGDYIVLCGKFPKFYVMARNVKSSRYNGTSPHPHVNSSGVPCLASYNKMIVEALNNREWMRFATVVSDFLSQYNARSPIVRL
ncbi:MAG: hypothetical protein ACW98K_12585 [Candidatus Kariarchaeaceae archaeon]